MCLCVCVYVCVFVCVWHMCGVCVSMHMPVCLCVYIMCVCLCVACVWCVCAYILYIYGVCKHAYVCVLMCVYVFICVWHVCGVYVSMHVPVCLHVYVCLFVCGMCVVCVCKHGCAYVCVFMRDVLQSNQIYNCTVLHFSSDRLQLQVHVHFIVMVPFCWYIRLETQIKILAYVGHNMWAQRITIHVVCVYVCDMPHITVVCVRICLMYICILVEGKIKGKTVRT